MNNADRAARAAGFPDAATMMAWNAHRQAGLRDPAGSSGTQAPGLLQRWFGTPTQPNGQPVTTQDMFAWHPANILNYVKQKFDQATGNQP